MDEISNVELRTLRYFVVLAEELHFRRAAGRLGMAQPPLSQAIQRLERDIGAELFDRSQRHVRLTEAGSVFLAEARRLLAQAERSVRAARRAAQGLVGSIRVTYVGAATYDFLPRLVRSYRANHPDVELQLLERTTSSQVRALQLGEADVGLVRPPVFNADDLRCETVLSESIVVALPDDHPLSARQTIELRDLAGESFIMFPAHDGPSFHARLVTVCEEAGFSMRVAQEAIQMHAIISLVVAGLGIALVPASMRNLRQVGVSYHNLKTASAPLHVDLAVMWRRGEPSSVVTGFLDTIRSLDRNVSQKRSIA
ncbi:LysR family transcriptional regulator [Bradyrhizobium sp. LHD-71]|uniref:LysR family transcriptional regulator n=1 Tax=Bradyrhizobium sp. LHD-71 TaxID=3072141 RepID=UPI00280C6C13|nr:LysR family transcriptional regulator [Bradyrhizobium sp. LHD-71]MDQ8731135.1 LysR family transcriptional regulator [Bradyrhizobium sp. LHD-71]